jgi:DNA-binding MarR family transcriptional regulator
MRASRRHEQRSGETQAASGGRRVAVEAVIDETRALFHRLRATAESLHGRDGVSAGSRGVLMSLARDGPHTVPQMARSRPTSRQHIQTLVNRLIEAGLATTLPNPAHTRSGLVALTPRGEELVATMRLRESRFLGGVGLDATEDQLLAAAAVLRGLRTALASHPPTPIARRTKRGAEKGTRK